MFSDEIDIKEREELAATRLQALWRGHLARKDNRKPKTSYPTNYFIYPEGNEPSISIPIGKKQASGKFVLIGCAGFKNLKLIKEIIDWGKYDFTQFNKNEMDNIPKLFIIDSSQRVYYFWLFIKKVMMHIHSLNQFEEQFKVISDILLASKKIKAALIPQISFFKDPVQWAKNEMYLKELYNIPSFFLDLCDHDEQKFHIFKSIISSATISLDNFCSEDTFIFIKKYIIQDRSIQPLYFYASNVLECISSSYIEENAAQLNKAIINNIDTLQPTLVVHARTPDSKGNRPSPDRHLLIFSDIQGSKYDQKEMLRDSNRYCVPIIGIENEEILEQKDALTENKVKKEKPGC